MALLATFMKRSDLPAAFKLCKLRLFFLAAIILALASAHDSEVLRLLYFILYSLPILTATGHGRWMEKAVLVAVLGIPMQARRGVAAPGVAVFGHQLILLYKLLFYGQKAVVRGFGFLLIIRQSRLDFPVITLNHFRYFDSTCRFIISN